MAGHARREAIDERQKTLDKLKKDAEDNKQQLQKVLKDTRQASRAASAPAQSRRLRQDLEAGVNPRRAKEMEKGRQRAAEHRMKQRKDR